MPGVRGLERGHGTSATESMLEISLLGPIRVTRDGAPVDIGGSRNTTLLALLALRAGTAVEPDLLIEQLWAGEPPDGSSTTLRTYLSRVRAALGDEALIGHVPAGYILHVPPEAVDVVAFERLVRAGRLQLERGSHRRAAQTLQRALALWRGRPFAGLADVEAFRADTVRLEELQLLAIESRIECDLALGRDAELVDELEGLLTVQPFRERLWRHLMLALYRAGRQADALAAYHRARVALNEQLGIEPSEDLTALEAAILRQDVPRPGARRLMTSTLPIPLTSFVGRSHEAGEVLSLVARNRLVTLVGVGGVGKTRLAIEVARRSLEDLVDAVAFVDLAAVADAALLPSQVATALGLPVAMEHDLPAGLRAIGAGAELLIVLDNCEHLRDAVAALAHDVLGATGDVRILATSRQVLDVAGEAPFPVPPLDFSQPDRDGTGDAPSEAVQLLLDRAMLVRHDLQVDAAARMTAARICQELDGLPLAIELAAARVKALSLTEIEERLHDRFQFLVSWRRLSAARHRTLAEAMSWSFELLAPEEQDLLSRMAVFPAGATLASITAVCADSDAIRDERLVEHLVERLVDASLVNPMAGTQGTRYRLLETVRQYAEQRLAPDQLGELRRRHAERVRTIAISSNLSLEGDPAAMRFEVAQEELPSIRSAIHWANAADRSLGLEIACALERFWVTNHPLEGIDTFTALLADEALPHALRARGLRCRGGCRYITGDFAAGVADYEAALALHRQLEQPADQAHLRMRLAVEAHRRGDPEQAQRLLDEADAIGGDARYTPDRYVGLQLAAVLALDDGRIDDGFEMLHRAADLAAEAGDMWWRSDTLAQLAERALSLGRLDEGHGAAREALLLARAIGDRQSIVFNVAMLAHHAALTGHGRRAGRLWGGIQAEVERGRPMGQWELEQEAIRAKVATRAGPDFSAGVGPGRSLALEELLEEALSPD